jgi:hypothetical protein
MAYSKNAPTDLLQWADENWTNLNLYTRFGASYHTSLPSHWAQQFLGLNCWEKWHARRTDIQRTSHVRDETSVKCNKQVTSKQEIRFSLTSID